MKNEDTEKELVEAQLYYYSTPLGMTERLAKKLPFSSFQIKGSYRHKRSVPLVATTPYVMLAPTYRSESEKNYVHRSQKEFLMTADNASLLAGVVGIGNTNFGEDYCKSADVISSKFGVPILGKVELSGTPDDVWYLARNISDVLNLELDEDEERQV